MSMQKLKGIKSAGAYTAQRSMLEHLLRLEEIILRETTESIHIPNDRARIEQQLKEYKEQHRLNNSFDIQDIQQYFLATAEQDLPWEKSQIRGIYTSHLIKQVEGDTSITIDMKKRKMNFLLLAINTPRHITINNTTGDNIGTDAGSYQGTANLIINNTNGNYTGAFAGNKQGNAHITISNTNGKHTGSFAGCNDGTAHLTIKNTKGDFTGVNAGSDYGKAYITIMNNQGNYTGECSGGSGKTITVAYNSQGEGQFFNHRGVLVLNNPERPPRIKGVGDTQKKYILDLIAQNASSEEVMDYLVKNT